jgi:hypothetical protein
LQGNITKEELKHLTGFDMDSDLSDDYVEIRHVNESGEPISDWLITSRFFATNMSGSVEIRGIKK